MKIKILLVSLMLYISILNSFGQTVKQSTQYEKDAINTKTASQNLINTAQSETNS